MSLNKCRNSHWISQQKQSSLVTEEKALSQWAQFRLCERTECSEVVCHEWWQALDIVWTYKSTYVSVKGWFVCPPLSFISRTTHWSSMKSDVGSLSDICQTDAILVFNSLLRTVQILLQINIMFEIKIINCNKIYILHKIYFEKITEFYVLMLHCWLDVMLFGNCSDIHVWMSVCWLFCA